MINLEKYNPCDDYIDYLMGAVSNKITSSKKAVIKYDKARFITNLTQDDITDFTLDNASVLYNDKGLCVIKPKDYFFIEWINKCPSFDFIDIPNLEIGGIIKRMFAQIEFGYYSNDEVAEDEILICDHIFKALYTNSTSIKKEQIKACIEKYNMIQIKKYCNKKVIDGIIYAAYDLYNSLNK